MYFYREVLEIYDKEQKVCFLRIFHLLSSDYNFLYAFSCMNRKIVCLLSILYFMYAVINKDIFKMFTSIRVYYWCRLIKFIVVNSNYT